MNILLVFQQLRIKLDARGKDHHAAFYPHFGSCSSDVRPVRRSSSSGRLSTWRSLPCSEVTTCGGAL